MRSESQDGLQGFFCLQLYIQRAVGVPGHGLWRTNSPLQDWQTVVKSANKFEVAALVLVIPVSLCAGQGKIKILSAR